MGTAIESKGGRTTKLLESFRKLDPYYESMVGQKDPVTWQQARLLDA